MYGCLSSILSHLAFSVLIAILTNSLVFGGIFFFLPFIFLIVYLVFHKEKREKFIKGIWPLLLGGFALVLVCLIAHWYNNEKETEHQAEILYLQTSYTVLELSRSLCGLPEVQNQDKTLYLNVYDEMKGMDGKTIVANLKYGMTPYEVLEVGDSISGSHYDELSFGELKPWGDYDVMFDIRKKLYGIEVQYYTAWASKDEWKIKIEDDLKQMVDYFTQKYGNPILNMRRENSYHVKWYNDGEVIYWHTIIFNSEYKSKLYFYLPLAYDNDQNNKV